MRRRKFYSWLLVLAGSFSTCKPVWAAPQTKDESSPSVVGRCCERVCQTDAEGMSTVRLSSACYYDAEEVLAGLSDYLKQLRALRRIWQEAAHIAWAGDTEKARVLLSGQLPIPTSSRWRYVTAQHVKKLWFFDHRWRSSSEFANACLEMESPDLAVSYLLVLREKENGLDFARNLGLAEALVENRQYSQAKKILYRLIEQESSESWNKIVNRYLEGVSGLQDNRQPPLQMRINLFAKQQLGWFKGRLGPILWVADDPITYKALETLDLLFKEAHDTHGQKLVWQAMAVKGADSAQCARALLKLANRAYQEKDSQTAFALWQHVEDHYEGTQAWAEALLKAGSALQELKEYQRAIDTFKKIPPWARRRGVTGAKHSFSSGNYCHYAALEVSKCYEALGRYGEALRFAQQAKSKYPFRSFCGTCQDNHEAKTNKRIRRLAMRVYGYKILLAVILVFAAGVYCRFRTRRLNRVN